MQAAAEVSAKTGEGVPQLVDGWESQGLRLTPSEGFLLSRIDGSTPWTSLRQIAGMPAAQVDACIERWIAQGIVAVAPGAADGADDAPELDASLDLPLELQRRILDFESALDRPYHELLGVAPDADARAIKRAFFGLSKEFHPDRYFRRRIGDFAPRLGRIFKRIALAYELLSDPAARAEIERIPAAPCEPPVVEPAPAAGSAEPPRVSRKRQTLDRLRRHFRIPEEVLAERRFRARSLRESARVAAAQAAWSEAASAIRLAIAFDPWSDEYKEAFAEIQSSLHQQRAAELLEHGGAGGLSTHASEALRQIEDALQFCPSDARLQHRAAELALDVGEVERAREFAERACELEPEVAAHHSTLGRVLRRAGERGAAREAFERARRLDPSDARAVEELDRLRRRPARAARGGTP